MELRIIKAITGTMMVHSSTNRTTDVSERYIWIYGTAYVACEPAIDAILGRVDAMKCKTLKRRVHSAIMASALALLIVRLPWTRLYANVKGTLTQVV